MTKDYSPFTPGIPVPKELFVGRKEEIEKLRAKVAQAVNGRLQVAFLSGERGMGKSSLASFTKFLVERDLDVIGIHTNLGGVTTLEEMVKKIFDRFLKDAVDKIWYENVREFLGNHIKQVGLFGFNLEFDAPEKDLKYLVRNFDLELSNLLEQLKDEKKGIFLILDDINGLASSLEFANWLKSFIDEVATSEKQLPLCILIVGYEERRQSLIKLQPSLARVFDLYEIRTWSDTETTEFFRNAFANVEVELAEGILDRFIPWVGGLPVLAHEIGDAVFSVDDDNIIDERDLTNGVMRAADIIGRKHLEPQVMAAIQSDKYRSILKKVGKEPFVFHFKRNEVLSTLSDRHKNIFDNFLRRMTGLGVFVREPEKGSGSYRFNNLLHYLYFDMIADRE